jgi:hypothetical protein
VRGRVQDQVRTWRRQSEGDPPGPTN